MDIEDFSVNREPRARALIPFAVFLGSLHAIGIARGADICSILANGARPAPPQGVVKERGDAGAGFVRQCLSVPFDQCIQPKDAEPP